MHSIDKVELCHIIFKSHSCDYRIAIIGYNSFIVYRWNDLNKNSNLIFPAPLILTWWKKLCLSFSAWHVRFPSFCTTGVDVGWDRRFFDSSKRSFDSLTPDIFSGWKINFWLRSPKLIKKFRTDKMRQFFESDFEDVLQNCAVFFWLQVDWEKTQSRHL